MARLFYLVCFFLLGCHADYSIVEDSIVEAVADSFVQANKMGALDILVVLDTSGSMSDNFEDRRRRDADT